MYLPMEVPTYRLNIYSVQQTQVHIFCHFKILDFEVILEKNDQLSSNLNAINMPTKSFFTISNGQGIYVLV